jgi:protein O-GlcNAc transferase
MSQIKTMFEQATVMYRSGQRAEAIAQMERLAQREPRHPAISHALASMLAETGQLERALYYAQVAAGIAPKLPHPHQLVATILASLNRMTDAEAAARKSLAIDPGSLGGLNTLGVILAETGRRAEGAEVLHRAMTLYPDRHEAAANYARLLVELGRADEAVAVAARAVAACPREMAIASARAFILNYPSGVDPREIFRQHVAFGAQLASAVVGLAREIGAPPATRADPEGRITIGYLSSDLRTHSVLSFVEHLIERQDRQRFRVNLYYTHPAPDARTERCRLSADLFRHVHRLDDLSLARQIRADHVDILVDLNGLSAHNRAGVLALRSAPIQLSYCGYCNTTGLDAVDARVVDPITDPPSSDADALSVERLLRLDRCFLCYRPPEDAPTPHLELDATSPDAICFGSFNAPAKISTLTLDLWCAVLRSEPRARFLIKGVGLEHDAARAHLAARFTVNGVDASRVTLLAPTASAREHLGLYSRVHVALDTTPYAGTTTTCEALWMGVPVVSLRGNVHAARVGASLLHACGRQQWIAESPSEFVEIALELGRNLPRLRELRSTLREELRQSALCDEIAHTRAMENAYLSLMQARDGSR